MGFKIDKRFWILFFIKFITSRSGSKNELQIKFVFLRKIKNIVPHWKKRITREKKISSLIKLNMFDFLRKHKIAIPKLMLSLSSIMTDLSCGHHDFTGRNKGLWKMAILCQLKEAALLFFVYTLKSTKRIYIKCLW